MVLRKQRASRDGIGKYDVIGKQEAKKLVKIVQLSSLGFVRVLYGPLRSFMVLQGQLWSCMICSCPLWTFMVIKDNSVNIRVLNFNYEQSKSTKPRDKFTEIWVVFAIACIIEFVEADIFIYLWYIIEAQLNWYISLEITVFMTNEDTVAALNFGQKLTKLSFVICWCHGQLFTSKGRLRKKHISKWHIPYRLSPPQKRIALLVIFLWD